MKELDNYKNKLDVCDICGSYLSQNSCPTCWFIEWDLSEEDLIFWGWNHLVENMSGEINNIIDK